MKNLPIKSSCILFGLIIGTGSFLIPIAWAHPILA